ncbi:unnamed protein product [Rotaria sp. Silwood1]|nr:unnamed protein product [Rotaria sp. Silwood1]CAF1475917.1 unnamed protein product [Rotaria sp. Silwood1]CAF1477459.1 unnamed protein product [Rotaria sp. Silwood1]CAF3570827.1 unnamed protein product [Rotaria sp. Silwood1]CAF3593843.1 unnamed protein product [Rotaria sp. Silwood1]
MAAGTHMAATQQAADDQASSLYFSGICQTISVKCQHRNENGLLTCSRNLYVSCPHCHLLLCIDHIHEHENLLRYEIEQLINETNIVKANIRALLTTSQQQPSSTTAQVLDEKQRTLCELLERWATVGKISMSQAALIQHQCGYISQTTQQQAAAASTAAVAAAALAAGATNHHITGSHHNINNQQNGSGTNKLPSHHQQHHTHSGHATHHQTNSHHHDRSSQQLASSANVVKKRRSGKNKIVTLLMKNAEGEYECPNVQCRKSLKCQGITAHVKACAVDWLKENGQYLNLN